MSRVVCMVVNLYSWTRYIMYVNLLHKVVAGYINHVMHKVYLEDLYPLPAQGVH